MRCLGMAARLVSFALLCSPVVARDFLIIDRLVRKTGAILYELPESDGRAEVIRSLGSVQRMFKGAEIVDAAMASEATLREKCSQTCLLYTTLGEGSKVVRAAMAKAG